jgi:hypothetical protein
MANCASRLIMERVLVLRSVADFPIATVASLVVAARRGSLNSKNVSAHQSA